VIDQELKPVTSSLWARKPRPFTGENTGRSLFLSFPLHLLLRGEVDTPAPTSGDSRPFELGRIDGGQRMTHTT
jgi:hypothetical protein